MPERITVKLTQPLIGLAAGIELGDDEILAISTVSASVSTVISRQMRPYS